MKTTAALAALLLASVGLNAWLLSRGSPARAGATLPAPDPAARSTGAVAAGPDALPETKPPSAGFVAVADAGSAQVGAAASAGASERLAVLEREVGDLQGQVDAKRPVDERFAKGESDPGAADRLRPELERTLGAAGVPYDLDCRRRICRIRLRVPEGMDLGKANAYRRDPAIRRLANGWAVFAGAPGNDPATGAPYTEYDQYALMNDEGSADGSALVRAVAGAFQASSSLADCTGGYADRGTFEAQITVSDAGWQLAFGGTLAGGRAGECLADRLRQATQAVSLPHPVSMASTDVELVSPPR